MNSIFSKQIFCLFLFFFATQLCASIRFESINLDNALIKAKSEKKLVFVDAYATWCGPCKVMDKVFEQNHVSDYFNDNYVNVKIDMDGPQGDLLLKKYGVVWLPTLLILNSEGEMVSKIDKLVSGEELISLAQEASSQGLGNTTAVFNSSPFGSSSTNKPSVNDYDPNEKESILYVLDERGSSGRPHIMFHEAYLHMQLRDGKQDAVVKKYLSTQSDWTTEKNIRFIFDFMNSVKSELFQYFVNNRDRFEEVIGVNRVNESVAFLINQRLEQGFPRPGLQETIDLFKHLNPKLAEESGYIFYLNKMERENHELEYISTAEQYLKSVNPYNHQVAHRLVLYKLKRSDYGDQLDYCLELMSEAVILEDESPDYYATIAKIYYLQKRKDLAISNVTKSIDLASSKSRDLRAFQSLLDKINAL